MCVYTFETNTKLTLLFVVDRKGRLTVNTAEFWFTRLPSKDAFSSHSILPHHSPPILDTQYITVLHAREFRSTRNLENWALEQSLPAIDSLKNKKRKPSNQGDHKIKSWLRFITISFPSNNLGKRDLHLNDPRTTNERSERAQRSTD